MERGETGRQVVFWIACLALAACESTASCNHGAKVDTRDFDDKIIARFAEQGLTMDAVECPDEFWYREDHDVMPCKARIGELEVDLPVVFDKKGKWTTEPKLPERFVGDGDAVEKSTAQQLNPGDQVNCTPRLYFWKGHDKVTCKLRIEGEDLELVVTRTDEKVSWEPSKPTSDMVQIQSSVTRVLKTSMGLDVKADCGAPRARIQRAGRRGECALTWDGGSGTLAMLLEPENDDGLVVATQGLPRAHLEQLLMSLYPEDHREEGDQMSCPEGAQLRRGAPTECDLVRGGKRMRLRISTQEDDMTVNFMPVE